MKIELPSEFAAFVHGAVLTGGFQSETDVVVAGLRLLKERHDDNIESLRKEIQVGMDQLARGERIPADEVFAELRRTLSSAPSTSPK